MRKPNLTGVLIIYTRPAMPNMANLYPCLYIINFQPLPLSFCKIAIQVGGGIKLLWKEVAIVGADFAKIQKRRERTEKSLFFL
jgi:hypothetical protein